jgi:glycosyltransferase involved in cell wall biosynthesis
MEEKLSILMLGPNPEMPGGVTSYIGALTRHLQRSTVDCFYVGSSEANKNFVAVAFRLLRVPFQVARHVRRKPPDVIHINPSFDKKSLIRDGLILLALRWAGYRRILVFIHGWDADVARMINASPFLYGLLNYVLSPVARIAVLAPGFKSTLMDMGLNGHKIVVKTTMFDPITLPDFTLPARPYILFMSRFDRRKGMYELLEAFSRIAEEYPNINVVMAGDGQEMNALKTKAAQLGLKTRVRFSGYVTGDDKARLLQGCSIYALPTYYPEGMPIALLEAMAAGKPLLTANAGGVRHIVHEPENGLVLQAVTVDSVEAGLRRMLADPTFCDTVGRRNAAYAQRFSASKVSAEIESLYQDIARSG